MFLPSGLLNTMFVPLAVKVVVGAVKVAVLLPQKIVPPFKLTTTFFFGCLPGVSGCKTPRERVINPSGEPAALVSNWAPFWIVMNEVFFAVLVVLSTLKKMSPLPGVTPFALRIAPGATVILLSGVTILISPSTVEMFPTLILPVPRTSKLPPVPPADPKTVQVLAAGRAVVRNTEPRSEIAVTTGWLACRTNLLLVEVPMLEPLPVVLKVKFVAVTPLVMVGSVIEAD